MNIDEHSASDIETIMEDKYTNPHHVVFTGNEFLDLINNKPTEFLRMEKYRDEGEFETKEVIQSAREKTEKIKAAFIKKKFG